MADDSPYETLYQVVGGTAFTNTGQCVSYAAQGNTLAPAVVADLSIEYVRVHERGGHVTYRGYDLMPISDVI